jgi:hypothetical protein
MADQRNVVEDVLADAMRRDQRAKQSRPGVRYAKRALRMIRNLLAILGLCFAYLLFVGFMQYQDRAAAGDVACTFTHCM